VRPVYGLKKKAKPPYSKEYHMGALPLPKLHLYKEKKKQEK